MGVKVPPQVGFNMARHADKNATLKEKKSAADYAGAEHLQSRYRQPGPGNLSPVFVNCLSDDEGNGEIENYTGNNAKNAGDERYLVRTKVSRKFSQVTHELTHDRDATVFRESREA